jgi:hypothetical protein
MSRRGQRLWGVVFKAALRHGRVKPGHDDKK